MREILGTHNLPRSLALSKLRKSNAGIEVNRSDEAESPQQITFSILGHCPRITYIEGEEDISHSCQRWRENNVISVDKPEEIRNDSH